MRNLEIQMKIWKGEQILTQENDEHKELLKKIEVETNGKVRNDSIEIMEKMLLE